jgi:signal transduction histidine kinase/CheY-like chemotaxis protein
MPVVGERILIADDEPDVLDLCQRILAAEGYQVEGVQDGWAAVRRAQEAHFDLLLADIKMPGFDGLEAAQAIKAFDPAVVCVTMTGFSTMGIAIEALKLGVDEFVIKPFAPQELILAITRALEKERLRKENVRLRALIPLFEFNKTLMSTIDAQELLQQVTQIAQRETKADCTLLYIANEGELDLQKYSESCAQLNEERQKAARDVARWVIEKQTQLAMEGVKGLPLPLAEAEAALRTYTLIATPLLVQRKSIGALVLLKEDADSTFTPSDSEFLSVLSSQAAIAIENARLFAEIQRAYEELKKLDHMKSEFINITAHELRTPLALLIGYATLLEEDVNGAEKHSLEIILRNAMRLRAIIDDMLNLRYLETGRTQLKIEAVNLREVIEEALLDLTPLAEGKEYNVSVNVPKDFPQVFTDRQKLDLVVVNLLSNAIKFTPARGSITIHAHVEDEQAVVSVQDTGIGIPAEQLDHIFERFYQVEDSLTREHGGLGIGLAIAKGMVELCGGKIWVESTVGKGSTFTFTLPLRAGEASPRPHQSGA